MMLAPDPSATTRLSRYCSYPASLVHTLREEPMELERQLVKAAAAIGNADLLVITSGAGMGVDSGLPDFRGDHGFWNAYPMYRQLGLSFVQAANPEHFERDPAFGWGFYGHRTNLYRQTIPHQGFQVIRRWIAAHALDHFVVTSNVDGQFQKAGFSEESIHEVHGSIHHLQCLSPCSDAIWDNREEITVDFDTMRAQQMPKCTRCGGVARPNILMFGDFSWLANRTRGQERDFDEFLSDHAGARLVVLEMGAGTAIPTIRYIGERLVERNKAVLIRINPREAQVPPGQISIPTGALEGLKMINTEVDRLKAEG
jgi:NAD-dependent SIR2 family protein deacetylase